MAVLPHEGSHDILFHSYAIPIGSGSRPGYVARPDQIGRHRVVVILPGIFGLSSFEKDLARQLARRGLVGITFDPYAEPLPLGASLDDAAAAYNRLADQQAMTDIDRAVDFAANGATHFSAGEPVGMIGVDTGRRFGLLYVADRPRVASLAVIGGPLAGDEQRSSTVSEALPRIQVPVLGLYGSADEHIPAGGVDVAAELNPSGEWLLYEAAGHDFLNPDAATFHAGAAADAMSRISAFFERTLPQVALVDY